MYINTLFKQGPRFKQGLEIRDTEFKTPWKLPEHTLHQNQETWQKGLPFKLVRDEY